MSETLQSRLAKRLDAIRMTPNGLSEAAGIHRDTIGKILKREGGGAQMRTLQKIAPILRTTPNWLATGEGDETTDPGAAGRRISRDIVFNVAYALHRARAAEYMNATQFANYAVAACEQLADDPETDLDSALAIARRQHARAG